MTEDLVRLEPIGFWSYARSDDIASDGRLSQLRSQLADELQQLYGRRKINIWQDVPSIAPGTEWNKSIDEAIAKSTFLVPILTPAFVESSICCQEFKKFIARENEIFQIHPELQGRRRIFPINYIDTTDADPCDPDVLAELEKLQFIDFTQLRLADDKPFEVRRALVSLAKELNSLLKVRVVAPPTAEELAEAQRRAAEAEALRKIAVAERIARDQREKAEAAERERQQREADEQAARVAEAARAAKAALLAAEAETARLAALAEAEKLAAERAAARKLLRERLRQWRNPALGVMGGVAALFGAVHYWPSSPPGDQATVEASAEPTADASAPAAAASKAPPRPLPQKPGSLLPKPARPDWINGTWEIEGKAPKCDITIAIKFADSLIMERVGRPTRVMSFKTNPSDSSILLASDYRFELLKPGSIKYDPTNGSKGGTLRACKKP
ncbi:toll/interleukin-1 receptor domain-containing protein [Novosphingobium sp.]|uniref:toll/interleukin-1 receptor domain-containing protein n=1 Tax=Novosphingobium sp. TaxID=1874826 RepID=UPI0038B6F598